MAVGATLDILALYNVGTTRGRRMHYAREREKAAWDQEQHFTLWTIRAPESNIVSGLWVPDSGPCRGMIPRRSSVQTYLRYASLPESARSRVTAAVQSPALPRDGPGAAPSSECCICQAGPRYGRDRLDSLVDASGESWECPDCMCWCTLVMYMYVHSLQYTQNPHWTLRRAFLSYLGPPTRVRWCCCLVGGDEGL
jgi:hypothetical protein